MIYRLSLRHPRATVLAGSLLVAAASLGLPRLELRTDGRALVPPGQPEVAADLRVRKHFGLKEQLVVVVESADPRGIFNPESLALVATVSEELSRLEGLSTPDIVSLATEKSSRVTPGTLSFTTLLDPLPRSPAEIERLRREVREVELYSGTLISRDERAAAILVGIPESADRLQLYRRVRELAEAHHHPSGELYVVGAPAAEVLLGSHILEDLGIPVRRSAGDGGRRDPPGGFFHRFLGLLRGAGLLPLVFLALSSCLWLSLGSLRAVLVVLGKVAATLLATFGLMGWCGVPVYLTTAVLPVILTAVSVADEVHILRRTRDRLLLEAPRHAAPSLLEAVLAELWRPVVKTSVTTAAGFLAFALSPIPPVRAFGLFAAAGVGFSLLWTAAVVPGVLVLLGPRWLEARGTRAGGWSRVLLAGLARKLVRRPGWTVLGAVAVAGAMAPGLARLTVEDSWIDAFAPESEFRRRTDRFHRGFLGSHLLLLEVAAEDETIRGRVPASHVGHFGVEVRRDLLDGIAEAGELEGRWLLLRGAAAGTRGWAREVASGGDVLERIVEVEDTGGAVLLETDRRQGSLRQRAGLQGLARVAELELEIGKRPFLDPEVHEVLRRLADFVREREALAVGGVLDPSAYLVTTRFLASGGRAAERRLPETPEAVRSLWEYYARLRGRKRLRELVDERFSRALLTVFLREANFAATRELMEDIRRWEREELEPRRLSLGFAGDVAVSQSLVEAVTATQVRSLVTSLAGVLAVTAVLSRSLGRGVLCVLPCSLAVYLVFCAMGLLGVPLGVATSTFAAMSLGVGIDYAIHVMDRCRRGLATGLDRRRAVVEAVAVTGPAVVTDALAVGLGFGVLLFSQVPPNARLGGLVALSVLGCLVVTLLLLPALLALRGGRRESAPVAR